VYVVEQNRDGQMFSLLRMNLDGEHIPRLRSVARLDGMPLDARSITGDIAAMEEK
jgi:2-oxoglutarate/2-oxoacid ferredoxin oxidoreductase subunit alpha